MKKLNSILHSKWFYIFLLFLTIIYSVIYLTSPKTSKINIKEDLIGIITDIKIDGDLLTLELKNEEKIIGNYYFSTEDEKDNFNTIYHLGDKVLIKGTYNKPKNNTVPNLFNYKNYLERKGIYYLIEIDSIKKIKDNTNWFYSIKDFINNYMDNYKSSSYLKALILGNTDLIARDVVVSYQENGISHLFAISGMHVSLLGGILFKFLKKIGCKDIVSYGIVNTFLLFFLFLSGCSASAFRSVMLFILLSINRLLNLNIKTVNVLILVFCFLVVINPNYLFEVGFQFSFIISFYLIILSNKTNKKSYLKNQFIISSISFLVSAPICIYHFNQINLFSIMLNIIFIPFVSIIIFPLSLITILLPFFDSLLYFMTSILEFLSLRFCEISYFKLIIVKPSIWWILLYYFVITMWLYKGKKIFIFFLILLCVYQYYILNIFPKSYFIMIDVGQGDSLLFHTNNKTMLIDTGGKITYSKEDWQKRDTKTLSENTLIPLFKSLGIRKIDYLILTHGDYDHMGEAINLVNNFKVEKVIFNCGEFNDLEQNLIQVLDKKKIPYHSCIKELNIDDNKLYFLNNELYNNENDNSNIIYTELNNYKFLFMGDAGVAVEKDLLEKYNLQNVDILKVGHHGSKTSSGQEFIDKINPKYSIISVGKNNRYGHPNESVLDNLEDSKIYRTDKDGSIMFKIKKSKLEIETCTP